MNYYKKTEYLLYNYKMLEISIENMELEIEYLRDNDGSTGLSYDGINTSPTNKTSNPTENVALSNSEKIHYLEHSIKKDRIKLSSIDRAMAVLPEEEKTVLVEKYINGKQWWEVCNIAKCSESTAKRYRRNAINKLIIGIFGEIKY